MARLERHLDLVAVARALRSIAGGPRPKQEFDPAKSRME